MAAENAEDGAAPRRPAAGPPPRLSMAGDGGGATDAGEVDSEDAVSRVTIDRSASRSSPTHRRTSSRSRSIRR